MAGPPPSAAASATPRALLDALERELLARLTRGAVGAIVGPIAAALDPSARPPSPAELTRAFQRLEDVMDAVLLAAPRTSGSE